MLKLANVKRLQVKKFIKNFVKKICQEICQKIHLKFCQKKIRQKICQKILQKQILQKLRQKICQKRQKIGQKWQKKIGQISVLRRFACLQVDGKLKNNPNFP